MEPMAMPPVRDEEKSDKAIQSHSRKVGPIMTEAYIIDAVRTPRSICKMGNGALSTLHPQHVAAVLKAMKDRNNLNTADVDDIIWGTSAQMGQQSGLNRCRYRSV
jgi:acetyl-CoA acetyltransferase